MPLRIRFGSYAASAAGATLTTTLTFPPAPLAATASAAVIVGSQYSPPGHLLHVLNSVFHTKVSSMHFLQLVPDEHASHEASQATHSLSSK
jgi:hypothetical protein